MKKERKVEFRNERTKEWFYYYILHNVRRNLYCRFRFTDPKGLTPEDVLDIEKALEIELGRRYVVEPKRTIIHISPDGKDEYERKKELARREFGCCRWPDNWYDVVEDYYEETSFDDWIYDLTGGNSYEREAIMSGVFDD